MARANKAKAARDYPEHGIKKGDTYYWWKFRFGRKQFSKTPPKASQLTQSEYLSQAYDVQDRVDCLPADSSLAGEVEDIVSTLREMADECEEKKSNMPDALQDSETGQLLEERAQACNDAADSLEEIDLEDFEEDEGQRELVNCEECGGSGTIIEKDEEITCQHCEGEGEVTDEDADPKNSDGQTEDEYWESKKEEVQNNFSFGIN